MIVNCVVGRAPRPQPALGGSYLRPRPLLAIRLSTPNATVLRDGLLDTGANDTVASEKVAKILGVDLSNAPAVSTSLVGRGLLQCRYAPVTLRITDGKAETYEWTTLIGFVPINLHYVLLGYAGFLQYFDADFRGADQVVELRANRHFPGVIY